MDPSHADTASSHDASHAESHLKTYWRVIITLTVLTAVEFVVAYFMHHGLGFQAGVLSLLAIAAWKAVLVAKFFMHLKYDPRLLAFIVCTPVILATPMILLAGFDLAMGPNLP